MSKKIMVVDDDPVIVKYLSSLFKNNGYETCSASNGSEALDVFEKETPDLITLDLDMPDEWGPKFYRKLTKKLRTKIPVVVISGLSGNKYAISNASATITKPFEEEHVLSAVKDVLG